MMMTFVLFIGETLTLWSHFFGNIDLVIVILTPQVTLPESERRLDSGLDL